VKRKSQRNKRNKLRVNQRKKNKKNKEIKRRKVLVKIEEEDVIKVLSIIIYIETNKDSRGGRRNRIKRRK